MQAQNAINLTAVTPANVAVSASCQDSNLGSRSKATAAREVVNLHRVNLRTLVDQQDGKFVSVDFTKQCGESRTLTGRLGVKSYLKGGRNLVEASGRSYLTVFDVQILEYRTVDLATVSEIRASGKVYRVTD